MATLRPFRALRPSPQNAAAVAAVPYDVVNTAEARALAANEPRSFLHVSRPEIDLPETTDPYADAVYDKAAENFSKLRRDAGFMREASPALYVYRLRMGDHVQTGPVFMTYRGRPAIDAAVERICREKSLYDLQAPDGIAHTIWKTEGAAAEEVARLFADVPSFYIADGHHRAASAARAREELRKKAAGGERRPYDDFLAVLFPAGQLQIMPYNRIVRDLNGQTPARFLDALRRELPVSEGARPAPERKGDVSVYVKGRWHGLRVADGSAHGAGPIASLDVSLLQERVLEPLLGIRDVRTDKRIDFVGGIRGTSELEKLVDRGEAAVAFSMYPVSLEELMAISDAGEIMPPKSTWFEPKLRDGLLIHEIGQAS